MALRMLAGAVCASALLISALVATAPADAATGSTAAGPSDASSAADSATASDIAVRFDHPVTVDPLTTADSLTQALPDGTMQFTSSAQPVRAEVNGEWKPIDLSLVDTGDHLEARVAGTAVQFSDGGDDELASVQSPTSEWLDEASPFGALPTPRIDGDSATYANVLPGVDLRVQATPTGMSEVLVIKTAAAAANPALAALRFALSAHVAPRTGGLTDATLADGSTITAGAPTWWDSSNGSTAEGPGGTAPPRPVAETVAGSTVTLNAAAAAQTSGVTYPVYVDPDWTGGLANYWYIDQAYPTQSYLNGNQAGGVQRMGWVDAANSPDGRNHLARAFYDMNVSGVRGKHILSAQFSVVLSGAFNCSVARPAQLWWATGTAAGATWNGTSNAVYKQVLDTVSPGGCGSSVGFDPATAVISGAAANASSLSLALRASNESDDYGWKKWAQSASLTVHYNSKPNTPTSPSFSSPVRSCGTSASPTQLAGNQPIVLQATQTDPDAGQNLSGTFSVFHASNLTTAAKTYASATQPQGAVHATIAAGTLDYVADNGVYAWSLRTSDGTDLSVAASVLCYFQVLLIPPPIPTVSVSGVTTVGKAVTVSISSALPDRVTMFAYWWESGDQTSGSSAPPTNGSGTGPQSNERLFSPLPPDGTQQQGVTWVLANSGHATVTTAPIDAPSTLWVASYNTAGFVSEDVDGSAAARATLVSAADDSVGVSIQNGHLWRTSAASSPLGSAIADANTSSGSGATAGQPLAIGSGLSTTSTDNVPTSAAAASPVLSSLGSVDLATWSDDAGNSAATVEGAQPTGYSFRADLGQLAAASASGSKPAGTISLYSCALSTGDMTSVSSTCEGTGVTPQLLGYIFTSAAAAPSGSTTVGLYRCHRSSVHFDSLDPGCEGDSVDTTLGYLLVTGQTETTTAPVDTTGSFSVSIWVKQAADTALGRPLTAMSMGGSGGAAFRLGVDAGGHPAFCVTAQTAGAVTDCAIASTSITSGTWTMLTGIRDSVNGQLRLVVNTALAATAAHRASGDTASAAQLVVGSATSGALQVSQWSGQLSNPGVFPGVISTSQLGHLRQLNTP